MALIGSTRRSRATRVPPVVLAFVLVPLLVEAFWVFWPALQGFYLSLTSWDGLSAPKFVGLGNFSEMVHDEVFRTAAINTVLWLLLFGGLSAALGSVPRCCSSRSGAASGSTGRRSSCRWSSHWSRPRWCGRPCTSRTA